MATFTGQADTTTTNKLTPGLPGFFIDAWKYLNLKLNKLLLSFENISHILLIGSADGQFLLINNQNIGS